MFVSMANSMIDLVGGSVEGSVAGSVEGSVTESDVVSGGSAMQSPLQSVGTQSPSARLEQSYATMPSEQMVQLLHGEALSDLTMVQLVH
jgi:hypothetical protein